MDKNSYIEENLAELFKFWSPFLCLGGAVVFLLLSGLDYVSTPEHFETFLVYRISIAGVLLIISGFSAKNRRRGIRFHQGLVFAGIIGASVTVELMIIQTGGHASSHYAGMGLIGIWAIGFVPTGFWFSLINALAVYGIYLLPLLAAEQSPDCRVFFTANVFLFALLASAAVGAPLALAWWRPVPAAALAWLAAAAYSRLVAPLDGTLSEVALAFADAERRQAIGRLE